MHSLLCVLELPAFSHRNPAPHSYTVYTFPTFCLIVLVCSHFDCIQSPTGVPGRGGPAEVLPPARPAGPAAHWHVVQQQSVQTAESLLLPIAPTHRRESCCASSYLFMSVGFESETIFPIVGGREILESERFGFQSLHRCSTR